MWATLALRVLVLSVSCTVLAEQLTPGGGPNKSQPNDPAHRPDEHFKFSHLIKKVAVIGAGTGGVQHAAALVEHGFDVRLFERKPTPGGVWSYSERKPLPAAFPCASSSPFSPSRDDLLSRYADNYCLLQ